MRITSYLKKSSICLYNPNAGWEGQKNPRNLWWLNTQKSKGQKADIQAMPTSVHLDHHSLQKKSIFK